MGPGTEAGKHPDWPGWLACEEHTPLVVGDGDCADFAAEAAELVGHEAFDRQEAAQSRSDEGEVPEE